MSDEECDMCFEYRRCSGEKCTTHVLYDGNVLELARALQDGHMWGDVIYESEKGKPKENPKNDRKALNQLKETILYKNRVKNCVFKNGKYVLKHKFAKECENLKLKEEVLSDGSTYPGGCWAHEEKTCPFMHPDEKGKFDMQGKSRINLLDGNNHKTPHSKTGHHRTPHNRTHNTRTHNTTRPSSKSWRGGKRTCTRRNRK